MKYSGSTFQFPILWKTRGHAFLYGTWEPAAAPDDFQLSG